MSDRKKNIAERFSRFEPEVDDLAIDKSWEKIKYFLPQEKKRRAFVWFTNKGWGRSLWVLLALGLLGGLLGLFLYTQKAEKTLATAGKRGEVKENKAANDAARVVATEPRAKDRSKNGEERGSEKRKEQRWVNEPARSENKPVAGNKAAEPAQVSAASAASQEKAVAATPSPEREDEQIASGPETTGALMPDPASVASPPEIVEYQRLQPVLLSQVSTGRNDSIIALEIKREEMPALPSFSRWSIELFGGPAWSATQMRYGENVLSPAKSAVDLSLGLGLAFQLNRKWSLFGNARFSRNSFAYEQVQQGNYVVDRSPDMQSSTPMIVMDTIIRYLPSSSSQKISAAPAYNICLDAGYSLFRKGKISMEASLGLSVKYSSYHTSIQNSHQQDTLQYKRGFNAPPLANEMALPAEYDKKQNFLSWGLVPGLAMVYQFHRR